MTLWPGAVCLFWVSASDGDSLYWSDGKGIACCLCELKPVLCRHILVRLVLRPVLGTLWFIPAGAGNTAAANAELDRLLVHPCGRREHKVHLS